jgi:hypothetical protein
VDDGGIVKDGVYSATCLSYRGVVAKIATNELHALPMGRFSLIQNSHTVAAIDQGLHEMSPDKP